LIKCIAKVGTLKAKLTKKIKIIKAWEYDCVVTKLRRLDRNKMVQQTTEKL
jgi:hypothetical protein